MIELKPCPFCGKEGIIIWDQPAGYFVGCLTTECRGRNRYSNEYPTLESAIQAWNMRAGVEVND